MIPDFIAGIGFVDDASVLAGAINRVRRHLKPHHHERARQIKRCLLGRINRQSRKFTWDKP